MKYCFFYSFCLCMATYMSYRLSLPFSVSLFLWIVSGVFFITGIYFILFCNDVKRNKGNDNIIDVDIPRVKPSAPLPPSLPSVHPYEISEKSQFFTVPKGKPLAGMSFSITGRAFVKRSNMICLIEHFGGEYHKSPRKNTTYLICGETEYIITGKINAARKNNNCTIINIDDFAHLLGVSYSDLKDHFFDIVDKSIMSEMKEKKRIAEEKKNNRKEFKKLNSLLKEFIKSKEQISLFSALQVIAKVDENEMELAEVNKVSYNRTTNDYILYAVDGEAIYLDDLRECSICDLADALLVA